MSSSPISISNNYPYTYNPNASHFLETEYVIPEFSAAPIPYRRLLQEKQNDIQKSIYEPLNLNQDDASHLNLTSKKNLAAIQ